MEYIHYGAYTRQGTIDYLLVHEHVRLQRQTLNQHKSNLARINIYLLFANSFFTKSK